MLVTWNTTLRMCENPVETQSLKSMRYIDLHKSTEKKNQPKPQIRRYDRNSLTSFGWYESGTFSAVVMTDCNRTTRGSWRGRLSGHGCVVTARALPGWWMGSGPSIQSYQPATFRGLVKHLHRRVCTLTFINAKSSCEVSVLFLFLKSCRELGKH